MGLFVEGKNTKDFVGSMNRNFEEIVSFLPPSLTSSNPMSLNVKDGKSWVRNSNRKVPFLVRPNR